MKEVNFETIKKVHCIGIGGIGISAVARMFLLRGVEVSGSDLTASEITTELEKIGANIFIGTEPCRLSEETDLVIFTVAIPENHPEFLDAKAKGIPTISYPQSLGLISKNHFVIAVAGTHGKTTTTAMVAKILIEAGLDPTVIVGSLLRESKSNFIGGKSKYFVVEACEYQRSFLNIKPDIAIITNIDDDHLDYYGSLAGVQAGFREFIGLIKEGGTLVTDVENKKIKPILSDPQIHVFDYAAVELKVSPGVPGVHNVQNAKAAFVVGKILGISEEKIISSLKKFSGTWRRFEEKGQTAHGVFVYDDYAHHPSEIRATLQAAREKFPNSKIVVVFQPHLYSRTKEHLEEFGEAFSLANEVVVLPIYAAREPKDDTINSEMLTNKIRGAGLVAHHFLNFASVKEYVDMNLKSGDVLVSMGAGDIAKLPEIILK